MDEKNAHRRLLGAVRAYEVAAFQRGGVKAARRKDVDTLLLMMDAIDDEYTLLYEVKLYVENMKTSWYGYFFNKCVFRMSLMRVVMSELGRLEKQQEKLSLYPSIFLQSGTKKTLAMRSDYKDNKIYQPITFIDQGPEEEAEGCWQPSGFNDRQDYLRP